MNNNSKHKLLLTTTLLTLLVISSAYAALMPNVHATEITTQDKALAVLDNVVGLNVTAYRTELNSKLDNQFWSLPQKEADISFASSQSTLRVRCSFVNNTLRQIYISELSGALYLKQPAANSLEMAKSFLERYRQYTAAPFYSELESMLGNVNINENSTKTQRNIKLEVSVPSQTLVNFIWTYTDENGVSAPLKNVVLSYDNGMLKSFLDNWNLYTIAGEPKLSSEEAIETTLKAFENFSYKVDVNNGTGTQTISKFKIVSIGDSTLCYLNYVDESSARDADPFTLYPSWNIPLGFDKVYPGGVTGAMLRIWADNGEVSSMNPMVSEGASPTTNEETNENSFSENLNQTPALLLASLAIAILVGAAGFSVGSRKVGCLRLKGIGKLGSSRMWGVLLCLLFSSSIILSAIPKVEAVSPTGKATLDASMHGQLYDEKQAGTYLLDFIDGLFSDNGYIVTNARVSSTTTSTTVSNVLSNASSAEQNYYRVAMFHFGHMAGDNTRYFDTNGDIIYASDVDDETLSGKHFFVFIWVCQQGQYPNSGMPFAWTQRTDMHSDGYLDPDYGPHCFIGFCGASPGISNATGSFQNYTNPAKYFIQKFYYYALVEKYSVHDALNIASGEFFNLNYEDSPLDNGFKTWWPYNPTWPDKKPDWYDGEMHVYGNGNIKLYQPQLTISARDNYNNQLYPTFYIDGTSVSTGSLRLAPGSHTFDVNSISGYTFDHFHFDYGGSSASIYYKPVDQSIPSDCILTVYYQQIVQYDLTISSSSGGSTSPSGVQQYTEGTYAYVTAYPDQGYEFDYWLLDGNSAGSNPAKSVYMDDDHTLQAVFCEVTSHWVTVNALDCYYASELYPIVYVDSEEVGTAPVQVYLSPGNHYVEVENPLGGGSLQFLVFSYYYGDIYANPAEIYVGLHTEVVTAWYLPQ